MKSLYDYNFLVNDVFYKCWHILDYIENHPSMPSLDREAIQATIMDALVYKGLVDAERESLDLDSLCVREDTKHYVYERHPNICGIPIWMKEEFRKHCLIITGSIPISLFLCKPPSKIGRYCVYDPNTAVSAIFPDATFYDVFYTSPTRGVRIDSQRPFVEVEIDGELYLVDILTKRIIKSSFFKEHFGFDVVTQRRISEMDDEMKKVYEEMTTEKCQYNVLIPFLKMSLEAFSVKPYWAEMAYEFEKSKELYPEEFEKAEEFEREVSEGILF